MNKNVSGIVTALLVLSMFAGSVAVVHSEPLNKTFGEPNKDRGHSVGQGLSERCFTISLLKEKE